MSKFSSSSIFATLGVLVIFFSIAAPGFFSVIGLRSVALFASEPLLLAVAETFVIISGGIDLSVGAVLGFTGVVGALVMRSVWVSSHSLGLSVLVATVVAVGIGTALGAISGTLIAKLRVPPFVVTLGMLGICRGMTFVLTSGRPSSVSPRRWEPSGTSACSGSCR